MLASAWSTAARERCCLPPIMIEKQLVEVGAGQISMRGVVRLVVFEKSHMMPLARESSAQSPPNRGIPVPPGRTQSEAKDDDSHGLPVLVSS
jgi:hypothetical protein